MSVKDDARLVWISERVQRGLEVTSKEFEDFYKKNSDPLLEFLDRSENGAALMFYTTVEVVDAPANQQVSQPAAPSPAPNSRPASVVSNENGTDSPDGAVAENVDQSAEAAETSAGSEEQQPASRAPSVAAPVMHVSAEPSTMEVKKLHLAQHHLPEAEKANVRPCRSMYFIKCVDRSISPQSDESNDDMMARSVEYGVMPGHSLAMLERLIKHVYLPIFEPEQMSLDGTNPHMAAALASMSSASMSSAPAAAASADGASSDDSAAAPSKYAGLLSLGHTAHLSETVRAEFTSNMQKFAAQIAQTMQQVSGDVHLNIPDVKIDNPKVAAGDAEVVAVIEAAVESWINVIQSVLAQEQHKQLVGTGPISEINFWRSRNASLSGLYEQLQTPTVRKMLQTLDEAGADIMALYKDQAVELTKLYEEAKNNVKFLTTLERHFKNIGTGVLSSIMDTIPPMMTALKMVWTISRHYNKDERMSLLMHLIAVEIAEKVAKEINIRSIFRRQPQESMAVIRKGKDVLDSWYRTYMTVREQIEGSDSKDRWDFDKKKLFEQTNYMSKICENLFDVAQTLDQFYKFLGPELKSVTGDSAGIDEVLDYVNNLVTPLENLPFNVFNRQYQTSWEQVMRSFNEKVEEIESRTKSFIDSSFQKLRSAEGAFDLLTNFKNIESRDSIRNQMMDKFTNILEQYGREVERVASIFHQHRHNPPCSMQQPPIAGAILWARSLYHRIKKSIIRFQAHGSLLTTEKGKEICKQYIAIAREITEYEERLFHDWEQSVRRTVEEKLKNFILRRISLVSPPVASPTSNGASTVEASKNSSVASASQPQSTLQSGIVSRGKSSANASMFSSHVSSASHQSGQSGAASLTSHLFDEGAYVEEKDQLPMIHFKIEVNFSPELKQLIREARYLERLGLPIPDAALNVALQENGYYLNMERLQAMLQTYREVILSLSLEQKQVLVERIRQLGRVLQPGFGPLNWNSLAIEDYIASCNRAIKEFQDIVHQIQKNAAMIEGVMQNIRNARLVIVEDFDDRRTKYRIDSLFERIERHRAATVEALVHQYEQTVSQCLEKIETLVTGKEANNVALMAPYFAYWERRMFDSLTRMIVNGVRSVHQLLFGRPSSSSSSSESTALILIKAEMNGSDIMTSPSQQDLERLGRLPRVILDSARSFVRWMRGTCVRCKPIPMADDSVYLFTFLEDVTRSPVLMKVVTSVNQALFEMFQTLQKYIEGWSSYDQKYGLWNAKKMASLERNRMKNETSVWFDKKLSRFHRLWDSMKTASHSKTIAFLELDTQKVISAIQNQAMEWVNRYGTILRELSEELMRGLYHRIDTWSENINRPPNTIEDLKFVLQNISEIQSNSMDMQIQFDDCIERFRTLRMYNILVKPADVQLVDNLHKRWDSLMLESKKRDTALILVKRRFTEITIQQTKSFQEEVVQLRQRFRDTGPGANGVPLEQGLQLMVTAKQELAKFQASRDELVNAEKLFNLPVTAYPDMVFLEQQLDKLERIFTCFRDQQDAIRGWAATRWSELQIETLNRGVDAFFKQLQALPEDLRKMSTYRLVEERLTSFQESVPLFALLKNDALRPRHWAKLMDVTNVKFDLNTDFTLSRLFAMELHRFPDEINNICITAQQEGKIERELAKVTSLWGAKNFPMYAYKGVDSLKMLGDCNELTTELEDNMMNLTTMANSQYAGHFKEDLRKWERDLSTVVDCMDVWQLVQRKWMYLEGIFIGSDDIKMQLPEAAKAFDKIDSQFKKIMQQTSRNPNVLQACTVENRLEDLRTLSSSLDKCQKNLSDYLESKRNAFARFFFVSDDELLSVLGSPDPTSVQPHMLKMFDNCKELIFTKQNKFVGGMVSAENESFEFRQPVPIEGAVESWMNHVEHEMQRTLQIISKEATFHYANAKRIDWIDSNIGMVGLSGSQCWWTWETEDAFRKVKSGDKHAMKKLLAQLNAQLIDLVTEIRRAEISNQMRKKINTLIIIDVHAKDIIDRFVRDSILDAREFAWESQLRFYWDRTNDDMIIRQCTGSFEYGYEYMGLNGRLVITPLTDRCYMTLTQALTFHMGGAPAGPAGTGKTETVKDLAKCLANPCMVTNCGEGLDYRAMGSIFSGLVQSGAWGCFDEFNRIDLEVLSVVSAQLQTIQLAHKLGKERFEFIGREIKLNPRCGIFITMNPGYAGRTELPDNLKALFRPVTMVVPDLLNICEISLFSEGFTEAKVLGKKMTTLYRLSSEQLSKQYHYDFGLRALKSVLVMAGAIKRESAQFSEDSVLMRALRDMNLPKFVFEDVPLFLGLINDLFPGLDCPRVVNNKLKQCVQNDLRENEYEHADERVLNLQVDKIMQLYETMLTRHTSMVVGPTQGGKTVAIETLARSQLKAFGVTIKLYTLNPKAQPVSELYGVLDPQTRDWQDGLLSKIFRETNEPLKPNQNEKRFIMFDGDVDALWVENMNSVMDDNKLLTLPNSERIRLTDHVRLIIEVGDLQYASPATVSRVGMVYVDPKNLGYKPMYERWLRVRRQSSPAEANVLDAMFDKYVHPSVQLALFGMVDGQILPEGPLKSIIPIVDVAMIKQLTNLYNALTSTDDGSKPVEDPDAIESIFVFCLMWSVGGALVKESRERFDHFVKGISTRPLQSSANKSALPQDLIYDAYFDKSTMRWVKWADIVQPYIPPTPFEFSKVMVPTVDTTRYTFLLDRMVRVRAPVLFCGESGTAKTITVQNFFNALDYEQYLTLTINFSSRTTSMDVQRVIEGNTEKRPGHIFGPPIDKKLLIFIDDLNMPQVDHYGTQQPLALLKFLVERSAVYGRGEDLDLKNFRDLMYLAAMAPPGGGRNPVDPRVVAMYAVFSIIFPSEQALMQIYSSILGAHLSHFNSDVQAAGSKMTAATMQLYKDLVANLPPTPSKFHYIFNLRDLSRVYEGLCLSTPDKFERGGQLVRLWRNECLRVFHDRLITIEDRNYVKSNLLGSLIQSIWRNDAVEATAEPILFGDYRNSLSEDVGAPRLYEDLESYANVRSIFDAILNNYNSESSKKMNLVLFQDALEHLTRIHRILRMPRGHALLVGVGGSGKQSLTRLATYAVKYTLFEIQLTRGYGETEFRDDLKKLYTLLGTENGGSPVVFLFTDAHVKNEGFLELINNMLTSGIVPALFAEEEKGPHMDAVQAEMTQRGLPITKETKWTYWVNRCRDNLHVVLCMSPAGENLRRRCRSFPGLVNNTVIDWFFPWPEEALQAVAQHFLANVELPAEHRQGVVDLMVLVHESVQQYSEKFEAELRRVNSVTPKNYLDLIDTYSKQLAQFRAEMGARYKRLDGGLTKLIEAAQEVDSMRVDLSQQKVIVDQKSRECADMINAIKERTAEVKQKQQQAMEKNEDLQRSQANIEKEKGEAEVALAEALPALAAAEAAVGNLDRGEIATLKAMKAPPEAVMLVFQCVLELRPTPDVDPKEQWKGAQRMMSDASFLQRLLKYDKEGITPKMAKACASILYRPVADPSKELNIANVSKVSSAAQGLLTWVIAVLKYYEIHKNVLPKQKLVKDLERSAAQAVRELTDIKNRLDALEAEVAELTRTYQEKNDELRDLQEKADRMERQLTAAAKLIDGLASERVRWTKDREELNARKDRLVGDCMLTASFLSYTGAFTFEYRHKMIYEEWLNACVEHKLPLTQPFRLENLLVSEVEISRWASEGLPSDELSIQNGILTTRASRFPLCIDPQMQASKWIKERESRLKKLSIHTFNDSDFAKRLELAIQFGNPFMFEGVEEDIDPLIDPVLEKNFVMRGPQRILMLGDKEIEWDPDFRLYLITKMNNPRYSPEVAGKTQIINYMVTMQGLEDQLLNVVVGFEQAKLQQTKEQLIQTMSENNRMLVEIENMLLKELTDATGNILDNANLIATLENAKAKSVSIAEQLDEMRITAEEIEKVTAGYRPAAKRGSILYFSMAGLSAISKMYEHSLSAYLDLFSKGLRVSEKDPLLSNRLNNIIKKLTKLIYDYVCMGIFEKHKLMYSFQMVTMIMAGDDQLKRSELDFFLKGNLSLAPVEDPRPADWISESGWKDLQKLIEIGPEFQSLITDLRSNLPAWKAWYDLEQPEQAPLPNELSTKLSAFQHLLIYRIFRPDRVYEAVKRFIVQVTKTRDYILPPLLNFENILAQSSPTQPVVFILSPGADPMSELSKMAAVKIGLNKFKYVALGQGQAPIATQNLEQGVTRGYWVVLQNCHLMTSWLRHLEKILDSVKAPHADFRLWMTTDPTPKFPIGILQRSFKVVTEPPDGLMLNMKASYSKVTPEVLEECPHPAFRPLVYVLTFFHAVVQERRKYGKVGWNVPYDFNESDFDVSMKLLSMYLTKAHHESKDGVLPWGSLRYLIGEAMYGGRVTDNFDRRVLVTYLDEYMGDFLFDDNNPFYFARVGNNQAEIDKFRVPLIGNRDVFDRSIDELPASSSPEVFGLHFNAQIGYSTNAAKQMWRELIDLQPRTATAASGISREDFIAKIAQDVKTKVPAPFDLMIVRKRFEDAHAERGEQDIGPTTVVLLQEVQRWNRLVLKMTKSLEELAKALAGETGMSNELDDLANSLYNGQLPQSWRILAPRTLKSLGSWMVHFLRRYEQYKNWIELKNDPAVIWLSGLSIPESYLTALVQTTCRKKKWPLDKSTLYTSVTRFVDPKEIKEKPEHGCYITGLFLEGAAWDLERGCLRRQDPKVLVVDLPILQVIPIEASKLKKSNVFETPVYVTQDRGNAMGVGFVFKADLATTAHPSHWVLQGCALVLNID